jgi:hypothetical protein
MADVWFEPRYAIRRVRNPEPDWLRDVILDPFRPGREFGEALIEFREEERRLSMILIADRELGYYLKYDPTADTWLSLGDASRLSEVVCPDDWEASAGLFVSPEDAWVVISEFCRTGQRSSAIHWIRPIEIPEDGNW